MGRRAGFAIALLAIASACALTAGAAGGLTSTRAGSPARATVAPTGLGTADAARTIELAAAPALFAPPWPTDAFVNRPGMSLAGYRAAKTAAAGRAASPRRQAPDSPRSVNMFQGHAALSAQCAASDGCYTPAGINGAVGSAQVLTVTNSHIDVYTKAANTPSLLLEKTLSTFFGYTSAPLFDPRVEWDTRWNRWVVTSDALREAGGGQKLFLAVSKTSDATGAWFVYTLIVPGIFRDYPQVGLGQDAIVMTYSDFASNGGAQLATNTFGIPKALAYNGSALTFAVFTVATSGTTTPANVIDPNPRVHELLEQPNGLVYNVTFQYPANGPYSSVGPVAPIIGIDATVPPQAHQPGPCGAPSCNIDTGDARFINDPTQYGAELWAANTIADATLPTPAFWEIWSEGFLANTVRQAGIFFFSGTSSDWNASIVALSGGRAMVTWSYDDASINVNPSMAMTGRLATDLPTVMNPPTNVYTSPHNLQGNYDSRLGAQRWGPTSSIRFDPGTLRAFGFNETVGPLGGLWNTQQGVLAIG